MGKFILAALFLTVAAAPSFAQQAKPVPMVWSQQEINAALQLFDAGVKAGGLRVAGDAAVLAAKFQKAVTEASRPVVAPLPRTEEKKP